MDKFERTVYCTISMCITIVFSILIIAGAQCQKERNKQKYETHRAAIESTDGSIIIGHGP